MTGKPPFFDDMAQLMQGAVGAAQGMGEEAKTLMRNQADRFIADMDLVSREEFMLLKEEYSALRRELDQIKEQMKALQGQDRKKKS